ncbi:guanylate kinase [Streptomyces sp. NPDC002018]|uniref:guanylate kinase n=1 Tax=Streptomyces sp. NPDC002018 TaxID=3364629 RepID=UPI0036C3B0E7
MARSEELPLKVASTGILLVLSGPSGIGKTSLITAMREQEPDLGYTYSVTTRKPRKGLEEHYEFVSREKFLGMVERDEFIQWIHPSFDEFYGTLRAPVEEALAQGQDMVFDYIPEGYFNLRRYYPQHTVGVFVMAPSVGEMRRRLAKRGTEFGEELMHRQNMAERDFDFVAEHDYHLINDDFDEALRTIQSIRRAERARLTRQPGVVDQYRRHSKKTLLRYYDPT